MRLHYLAAFLLVGPFAISAGGLSAQDTTQAKKDGQQRDSTYQQNPQANTYTNTQSQDQTQLSDEQVVMKMHHTNQMEIRVARLAQSHASSSKVKSLASRLVRDHQANDKKVVALAKQLNITLRDGRDGMDSTGNAYPRGQHRGGMDSTQRNDSTYSSYPRSDTTNQGNRYGQQSDTSRRYGERFDSTQGQYGQGRYGQQGQDSTMAAMWQLQTLHGAAFDTAFANVIVNGHNKAISMLEQAQNQVQRQEVRALIASTLPTLRQHLQLAQALTNGATTTSSR
jgi:putative membrane protein